MTSRAIVQRESGVWPECFAYPYGSRARGDYTDITVAAVRENTALIA